VAGYPGLDRAVTTYTSERVDEVLGATGRDVAVRIYGQDLAVLEARAEEVGLVMSQVDGIAAPAAELPIMEPTLEIEVDLDAAARYGVKAGDVRRAATSLLSGIEVGNLFEDQKVFEVVVWGIPELRHSVNSVQDLLIETPSDGLVRLADVASVRIQPSPSVIDREGVMRYVDVSADVAGRDIGAVVLDLKTRLADVPFALEYHAEILSPALERQDAQNRLLAVVAGVAILVLLLLQAAFGSWRLAAFVLLALPAATLGGALTTLLTGDLVSMGALAGLITVAAITVRHAITLVQRYRQLEATAAAEDRVSLAMRGAQERLAPTLVTALGTAAFALPFIVMGDVAGLEIMRPMAVFILGSLISSTVLLLFVLPSIYLRSGPSPASETETLLTEPPAFEPTPA
jgi:Cu/Ag efflux pump CusA